MDNERDYPINCRVSLPGNMLDNTGKIFKKEKSDIAEKRMYWRRSSYLLNPRNNYCEIIIDNEMVYVKDHPSINDPNPDFP